MIKEMVSGVSFPIVCFPIGGLIGLIGLGFCSHVAMLRGLQVVHFISYFMRVSAIGVMLSNNFLDTFVHLKKNPKHCSSIVFQYFTCPPSVIKHNLKVL